MKILFGTNLDGCPCPAHRRGVGKLVCGPQGLLSILEVATGIPPSESVSELERLLSYREALDEYLVENTDAFFARSYSVESLSTSRVLLRWRDELKLAGWSLINNDSDDLPQRLNDLAGIESIAAEMPAFRIGVAERIDQILGRLEQGAQTGVDQIVALEPPDTLATKWTQLLEALPVVYDLQMPTAPAARPGTRLHTLQSRLLSVDESAADDVVATDESVVILRDFSEVTLARAAAQHWRDPSVGPISVLVAPTDNRRRLNESLEQLDQPKFTAQESSLSGSLTQLLPLSLKLHWDPFDPQAWLEFLLHPVCPVAGSLRYRLARAINGTPGRGNGDWKKAIEQALERVSDDTDQRTKIEKSISSWVELPTFDRDTGIPGEVISSTASQLANWMRSVGVAKHASNEEDASMWISAAGNIDAFGRALGDLPQVSHQELDRLLAIWLATSGDRIHETGEIGAPLPVSEPGQVLSAVDHLFWWQPDDAGSYRVPWSLQEREWLAGLNISLLTSRALLEADDAANRRAILNATESLTVFVASGQCGSKTSPVVTRIVAELGSGVIEGVADKIKTAPLSVRPLPAPRRWWQFSDPALLAPRAKESFSSSSKMIYSPYQWVLNYKARLEDGRLFGFGVGDDFIRRGNLLHDLAERLFMPAPEADTPPIDWTRCDEASLRQWLDSVWPALLAERAAQYRMPGFEAARNGLLHTGRQALWQLVHHFQEAGVTSVEVEKYIDGVNFVGGELNGRIDLVARTADAVAVVDLKLGGKSSRSPELADNRHLQLAVYGHLLQQTEGVDPAAAFFIFSRGGSLLTRTNAFFPGAAPVSLNNAGDSSEWSGCWQDFETIWQWRRSQLDAGRIEVTVGSTESDQIPPLEHWAAPEDADKYNDFDALTGWPRTT